MNDEVLRSIKPRALQDHVREEWERQQLVLGALERALRVAIEAYRHDVDLDELPGISPALDAPLHEWVDYFVTQGVLVYHDELPLVAA